MLHRDGLLWITDPWESLDHPRDTTLRLMQECATLGIPSFWADVTTVRWSQEGTFLEVLEVPRIDALCSQCFSAFLPQGLLRPSDFRIVLYRPDPPVDLAYLHPLQMIVASIETQQRAGGDRATELVNPAKVLLARGEKTEGAFAGQLMPPSIVASRFEVLERFGREQGRTVLKPLHQAQSKGVQLLDWSTEASRAACEHAIRLMTEGFRRPVLLQRYLPEVLDGETRIWLVDGEVLGAARKKPAQGTFRIDMDKGGRLERHALTAQEQQIAKQIGAHLKQQEIRLAAVDVIAGWVTDFNFTSPGLLPAMEVLEGKNLAREVIRALAPEQRL